jgi:hypothetical protein
MGFGAACDTLIGCDTLIVMEPARITVTRNSPDDVKIRQVAVSIDGKTTATLLYGESVTREVEPGPHRLRVHNTLVWKTVDVVLSPGEHARFTAVNRAGFGTYWMVGLLGAGPLYLTVRRDA